MFCKTRFILKNMRRLIFGIFAHPDDEAFGPCGSLLLHARDGHEVYLLCATDGSQGQSSAEIRTEELENSAAIIGAKRVFKLDFSDGKLCNGDLKELAAKIQGAITEAIGNDQEAEVSFITFEQNGLTGHLDHIAVSLATTFVYTHPEHWLPDDSRLGTLKYFCLCDAQKGEDLDYFIYSPKGYREEEVDETVDVSAVLDLKKQAIQAHASQDDYKKALALGDHLLTNEHFIHYKH